MVKEINDNNFKFSVLESDKPVLVDFWAPWCGPCKSLSTIIDEISREYQDKALIVKLNVDENSKISSEYSIQSIPTLIFFKDGEEVDRKVGLSSKAVIKKQIENLIG